MATAWNVWYGDALIRPRFAAVDLELGRGLDYIRNGCARSWDVWRSDAPVVGARAVLRWNDRVRLKRQVTLNGGAVVLAVGREGVVTRAQRQGRVGVRVGDNNWSTDEADEVLDLVGGQR
eukprot:gene15452-2660_t